MALTVSSFNSNSVNTLFSSMNAGNNKNNSFGSLTSSLSDYNLIRSGSYFKLMKSYFADPSLSSGVASSAVSKFKDTSISNPADLKETVKMASALSDDALALRAYMKLRLLLMKMVMSLSIMIMIGLRLHYLTL